MPNVNTKGETILVGKITFQYLSSSIKCTKPHFFKHQAEKHMKTQFFNCRIVKREEGLNLRKLDTYIVYVC